MTEHTPNAQFHASSFLKRQNAKTLGIVVADILVGLAVFLGYNSIGSSPDYFISSASLTARAAAFDVPPGYRATLLDLGYQ